MFVVLDDGHPAKVEQLVGTLDGPVRALTSLAAAADDGALDRTILIGDDRQRVVDQLVEHDLLGAIELGEPGDWTALEGPRMFARKAIVGNHGSQIATTSLESKRFALWTDATAHSASELLAIYARLWRAYDVETVFRGPVEIAVRCAGTGLHAQPTHTTFPWILDGLPGGGYGFAVWTTEPDEVGADRFLRGARRVFPFARDLVQIEACRIPLLGADREAACLMSPNPMGSSASCVVEVPYPQGVLMVSFGCLVRTPATSCAALLAMPPLRKLARTLRVAGVTDDE